MHHAHHPTGDRRPLYVGVEDGQEDADPGHRGVPETEFGRRNGGVQQGHQAVGGSHDGTRSARRHPRRVPEKECAEAGQAEPGVAQPAAVLAGGRHAETAGDEREAGRMQRRDGGTDQFDEALGF